METTATKYQRRENHIEEVKDHLLYTIKETCYLLGITEKTLYNWTYKKFYIKAEYIHNRPKYKGSVIKRSYNGEVFLPKVLK